MAFSCFEVSTPSSRAVSRPLHRPTAATEGIGRISESVEDETIPQHEQVGWCRGRLEISHVGTSSSRWASALAGFRGGFAFRTRTCRALPGWMGGGARPYVDHGARSVAFDRIPFRLAGLIVVIEPARPHEIRL